MGDGPGAPGGAASGPWTLVGARVVDPASGRDGVANVVVDGNVVAHVGAETAGRRLDASGLVVAPGFVDLHVHFREPGGEDAETVATGSAAAAAGGFTAVFPMANTNPTTDTVESVEATRRRARAAALCDVEPVAALTYGLAGERATDMRALALAGVRVFSDDGIPVRSATVMRSLLRTAAHLGVVVCNHAQEPDLTVGAQANEGEAAASVDLVGWPGVAEAVMVARDVLLAEDTGARLHVPHVSTRATVDVIRAAKRRGVAVTAEAAPHHFTLTDEVVRHRDAVHKVNPPVRTADDVDAVRTALADGTIDVVATDHAPHAADTKSRRWEDAPFGMLGLETALAVTLTSLVHTGKMDLPRAVALLATGPAAIGGLHDHGGPLLPGAPANLTVFDPDERWTVDPATFASRSRNSPYRGAELRGRVVHTVLRGRFTFRDGTVVPPAER